MKVSDADREAVAAFHKASFDLLMALPKADVNGAHKLLVQAFARHRHEAIEMAAGVIENECDELTFEQRNTAARKVRALAGEGE